jgi:dTDP-4-dehydrorhamnose 3,5-epimerase
MRKIKGREIFSDDRGNLKGVSSGLEWREVNKFFSVAGSMRGEHYHKTTIELIYLIEGKVEFTIKNIKTKKEESIMLRKDEGILIEPYEHHTARILEDTSWISLLSKEYKNDSPDIHND